ncbi:MAG TPA: hypothetical protein VFB79_18700 [Candidatus Angelobacter sp.]|nr:hypothetical protein [Candidatus Angelobacter sp.]
MMSSYGYQLKKLDDRWIIVCDGAPQYAWSGSRWVPIAGTVQACSFASPAEAHRYVSENGLGEGQGLDAL